MSVFHSQLGAPEFLNSLMLYFPNETNTLLSFFPHFLSFFSYGEVGANFVLMLW